MEHYSELITYVLCFCLGTFAAATRQLGLPTGRPMRASQVVWSSLYSGFTALTAALTLVEMHKLSHPGVVATSIGVGLMGTEAYNVIRNVIVNMIRSSFPDVKPPPGPGPGTDVDPDVHPHR